MNQAPPADQSDNEIVSPNRDNYVITDTLSDGEVERRVKFNGVTAKETAVGLTSDKKPWVFSDYSLGLV